MLRGLRPSDKLRVGKIVRGFFRRRTHVYQSFIGFIDSYPFEREGAFEAPFDQQTQPYRFNFRLRRPESKQPPGLQEHTAAFAHVLVLLAAGFALCFGESTNLT
jgi:hypothetical protein